MHSQAVYRARELVAKITTSDVVLACSNLHTGGQPTFSHQMVLIASVVCSCASGLITFLPSLSFWATAAAAVLKGEHADQQHPVYVLGRGRVSEKYLVDKSNKKAKSDQKIQQIANKCH